MRADLQRLSDAPSALDKRRGHSSRVCRKPRNDADERLERSGWDPECQELDDEACYENVAGDEEEELLSWAGSLEA